MERETGPITRPSVLVTGAARGLGFSLVWRFLDAGYDVYAGVRSPSPQLDALHTPHLHPIELDVTDDAVVATAARSFASLDVLINNAAICEDEGGRIETLDVERAAAIIQVNTLGPLRVTKAFLPHLRNGTMKTIVNISSEAGSITNCWRKGMFGYSMSKAGLNMQSKLLHNYLKGDGFRILSIHPGWMRTDMGGPNADIDPGEAAEGIYRIVSKELTVPIDALYVDYRGIPLPF